MKSVVVYANVNIWTTIDAQKWMKFFVTEIFILFIIVTYLTSSQFPANLR